MRIRRAALGAILLAALGVGACSERPRDLRALARQGAVQEDAPIKADASVSIAAPRPVVWRLLADVDDWPRWRRDLRAAELNGALRPGTAFSWTADGVTIHARLALVRPGEEIAWTGSLLGLKAIHVWRLSDEAGGVRVRTRETMSGFPAELFYSSADLQRSDEDWLAALKRAAEGTAR